jgi:hypothetical protein
MISAVAHHTLQNLFPPYYKPNGITVDLQPAQQNH